MEEKNKGEITEIESKEGKKRGKEKMSGGEEGEKKSPWFIKR